MSHPNFLDRLQFPPSRVGLFRIYVSLLIIATNVKSLQMKQPSSSRQQAEIFDYIEDLKGSYIEILNQQNVWTVIDPDENYACILLQGSLKLKVPYLKLTDVHPTILVPTDAAVEGSCSTLWGDYQEIKLKWNVSTSINSTVVTNSLYLGFVSGWKSDFSDLSIPPDQYALNSITVVYHADDGSIPMSYSVSDFIAFQTPRGHAFSCSSVNTLSVGELEFQTSDLRLQAFSSPDRYAGFYDKLECNLDLNTEFWEGIFEFMKWFAVASTIVVAVVAILYVLLRFVQKRLDSWSEGYKVLWTSWSS